MGKKIIKFLYPLGIFALLAIPIQSEDLTIQIDEKTKSISILPNVLIHEDKESNIDITHLDQIKQWEKTKENPMVFKNGKSTFWIKFTIENKTDQVLKMIIASTSSRIDKINFVEKKDGAFKTTITGDTFPFENRPILNNEFAFPVFISPGLNHYYISLHSKFNVNRTDLFLETPIDYSIRISNYNLINGIFFGILIVMSLYNLFLFLNTKNKSYFYLSQLLFFYFMYIFSLRGYCYKIIYPNYPQIQNSDLIIYVPFVLLNAILFTDHFLNLKQMLPKSKSFVYILYISTFVFLIYSIFYFDKDYEFLFKSLNFLILIGMIFLLLVSTILTFKKYRQAYFFLISWIFLLIPVIIVNLQNLRWLSKNSSIDENIITIGVSLMSVSFSLALADKINILKNELLSVNDSLEKKVEERTQKLKDSLHLAQKLKNQQDGDYYLATCLSEPLNTNKVNSKYLFIDFLIEQKKKFSFQNSNYEIGGDICISDQIEIENRKYSIILNGDAMGKSLQGAAGLLILGSVFSAILNKSKLDKFNILISPERWMKNTFIELSKTFEVFDLSMMVSIVLILIDEETGCMYHINAEHPHLILFRDNKAEYIIEDIKYTKLGNYKSKKFIKINTFQLKNGDTILFGSDGREDILYLDENGEQKHQIEEERFLEIVEKTEAQIFTIYEELKKIGEFKDDVSLGSINYKNPNIDFDKVNETKAKILEHYYNKEFSIAEDLLRKYILEHSSDTHGLHLLAKILTRKESFQEAISVSERILIRNPFDRLNILLLIKLNLELNLPERVAKLKSRLEKII
jgi:hypothetical protein